MSFELSLYCEAHGLNGLCSQEKREEVKEFLNGIEAGKIYIEAFRGDDPRFSAAYPEESLLLQLKNYFESTGLKVAGGIIFGNWAEGFGKELVTIEGQPSRYAACLTSETTKEFYRKVTRKLSTLFDEFLIDDWFCTRCFCDDCIELFNQRFGYRTSREDIRRRFLGGDEELISCWMEHSSRIVLEMAELIRGTARAERNDIRINWKLPECNENFYFAGMDLDRLKDIFDYFCGIRSIPPSEFTLKSPPQFTGNRHPNSV